MWARRAEVRQARGNQHSQIRSPATPRRPDHAGRRPTDAQDPARPKESPLRPRAPRRRLLVLPLHARLLRQVEGQMGLSQGPSFLIPLAPDS